MAKKKYPDVVKVPDDPSLIKLSKAQAVAKWQKEKELALEVEEFKASKRGEKANAVPEKEVKEEKVTPKKGRPKKVE